MVHSTTKYLGGHSDMVGGAVLVDDEGLRERLAFLQNAAGGVPGPWDAGWRCAASRRCAVRMEQHEANARSVAEWLAVQRRRRSRVLYPGLPRHPGHELARLQMAGFGGMVSLGSPEARPAASGSARRCGCSRSARASVASSRCVTTRPR